MIQTRECLGEFGVNYGNTTEVRTIRTSVVSNFRHLLRRKFEHQIFLFKHWGKGFAFTVYRIIIILSVEPQTIGRSDDA